MSTNQINDNDTMGEFVRKELVVDLNGAEGAARRTLVTLVELISGKTADDGWDNTDNCAAAEGLAEVIRMLEDAAMRVEQYDDDFISRMTALSDHWKRVREANAETTSTDDWPASETDEDAQ